MEVASVRPTFASLALVACAVASISVKQVSGENFFRVGSNFVFELLQVRSRSSWSDHCLNNRKGGHNNRTAVAAGWQWSQPQLQRSKQWSQHLYSSCNGLNRLQICFKKFVKIATKYNFFWPHKNGGRLTVASFVWGSHKGYPHGKQVDAWSILPPRSQL